MILTKAYASPLLKFIFVPKWDFSKLRDFYEAHVPKYAQRIISRIRKIAQAEGFPVYLVGGGVRELVRAFIEQIAPEVLENYVFDTDICVVGEAIKLAELTFEQLGGTLEVNLKFQTAKLTTAEGYLIDFATARTEFCEAPGALPTVSPTENIYEDLLRRDFTINALAMSLTEDGFGELLDPSGGVGDIFNKELRIMHPLSFFDDPTRIFRALRYSSRLSYHLEEATQECFHQAIEESFIDFLSPERIRYELERILDEPTWFGIMWSLSTTELLQAIHPGWTTLPTSSGEDAEVLELTLKAQSKLLTMEMVPANLIRLSWCLWLVDLEVLPEVLSRLGVFTRFSKHIIESRTRFEELRKRMNYSDFTPSRIYRVLIEYPRKTLLFSAFASLLVKACEPLRANLFKYLSTLSPKRNILSGEKLEHLGIPAGPLIGKIQDEIWWRFLDGEIADESQAEKFVVNNLSKYVNT